MYTNQLENHSITKITKMKNLNPPNFSNLKHWQKGVKNTDKYTICLTLETSSDDVMEIENLLRVVEFQSLRVNRGKSSYERILVTSLHLPWDTKKINGKMRKGDDSIIRVNTKWIKRKGRSWKETEWRLLWQWERVGSSSSFLCSRSRKVSKSGFFMI